MRLRQHWREIAAVFLKLGAVSYGGPAIMGMMQAEVQEKRRWLSKEDFIQGLALVNLLPGAGATQLGIFLGYIRAGWWGGLLAGLCFIVPAFFIMLILTWAYIRYGALPSLRGVFHGLAPVVIGIFIAAGWRLSRVAIKDYKQIAIALVVALTMSLTPIGIVPLLLLAGGLGVIFYGVPRWGYAAALLISVGYGLMYSLTDEMRVDANPGVMPGAVPGAPDIIQLATFFFKVGAFSFGGGLSMLAFMQDQVVHQLHWLTQQQFIDGLALGQFTPGPILMIAAFVGYQVSGLGGAIMGWIAIFLPSFLIMLSVLPLYARMQGINWAKAALKGISPALIGMVTLAMLHMLAESVPDMGTVILLLTTLGLILSRRTSPLPLMLGGAVIGWLAYV